MVKWQSTGAHAAKVRVRRPMTACYNCRAVKVKCDGQKECGRCASRGIVCAYTQIETANASRQSESGLPADTVFSQTGMDPAPGAISTDLNMFDAVHRFPMDGVAFDHTINPTEDWPNIENNQRLGHFEWGNIDPQLDVGSYHRSHDPLLGDLLSSPNVAIQSLTPTNVPSTANSTTSGILAPSPTSHRSCSSTQISSATCRCRKDLAALLPEVRDAIQEKQLDKVYKITQSVMRGCRDTVDCTSCQLGCTDLICLAAIIQQTDACFEYISKADPDNAIQMSFGGFGVPINDPKLRAMVVLNLIQDTFEVLDAISIKGQDMLRALGSPSTLAQTNILYLETVIRDFREVLRKTTEFVNQ